MKLNLIEYHTPVRCKCIVFTVDECEPGNYSYKSLLIPLCPQLCFVDRGYIGYWLIYLM